MLKDIVVSHDYRTARYYADQFGMPHAHCLARASQLRGYDSSWSFVYVNADNGVPDTEVIDELKYLESMGATVDWVGYP